MSSSSDPTDSSELQRLRHRVSELEQQQGDALLLHVPGIGAFEWRPNTSRMNWSPELFRILGLDPERDEDTIENYRARIHPEDLPRVARDVEQTLSDGRPYHREYRIVRPAGDVRYVAVQGQVEQGDGIQPARLIGTVRDITKLHEMQEQLRRRERVADRLLDLHERERRLLAYEIHDGFIQDVVGAQLMLGGICATLRPGCTSCGENLLKIEGLLARAIDEGRRLIGQLRPLVIDEQGIVGAIDYLVGEAIDRDENFQVHFTHDVQFDRLDPLFETTVFRIVQESLQNARRHSGADGVDIRLIQQEKQLSIEVEDRGKGFDPEQVPDERFGLEGIVERARLFGGSAEIVSHPGQGTRIRVRMPIHPLETIDE